MMPNANNDPIVRAAAGGPPGYGPPPGAPGYGPPPGGYGAPPGGFGGPPPPGPPPLPPSYGGGPEAPGAKTALICGIIGLLCCGIVLGPVAIVNAMKAKRAIEMDPSLSGGGMATAGLVLGIIAVVLNILGLIVRLAAMN
jgi:hypothetical protein